MRTPPDTSRDSSVRIKHIHDALMANRYPNARQLARELSVSVQTIRRDMKRLRTRMRTPIEYDEIRHGFYYDRPPDSRGKALTIQWEVLPLLLLRKAAAQYEYPSFAAELDRLVEKLKPTLDSECPVPLDDIEQHIALLPFGPLIEFNADVWSILLHATLDSRVVIFEHVRTNSSVWKERRVAPYTLFEHKDAWYVCGRDFKSGTIKSFSLSRMRKVRQVRQTFERPEDFSLAGFLANTFGVYRGTGDYRVRVEFDPFAAESVRLRRWHPSQKITEGENGSLIVEFRVNNLNEVLRWVLSWGRHARVLEPADLISRLRQDVRACIANHE